MDRLNGEADSDIPTLDDPKNETVEVSELPNIPIARRHTSTPTIMDFECRLAALIGKPTDLRPFVCDGSPLACQVFIVGFNPATTMSSDFWEFWETGKGFNKATWFEAYKQDRQTRPLKPGKTRRNPVSNTRRVIDWVLESVTPIHCLETNIYSAPTESAADLSSPARVTAPFDFLLANIKPKVIVAHGADAVSHLQSMALSAQVIPVSHFSRGWSRAAAHELGQQIKAACNDVQEPTSSDTSAKLPRRHSESKLGHHTTMDTPYTPFMRDLETRFQRASGLANRSDYKIYYGQVHPAPILVLGINPGGAPSNTNPDGRTHKDGVIAAASSSYFENDEHDILDCEWRENHGLRSLLTPLVGGDAQLIRQMVVKTNIAFHRSAKKKDIDIDRAKAEAAPFLAELIGVVKPSTILLTGVSIDEFNDRFASTSSIVVPAERDPRINQVVFAASKSKLRVTGAEALVVQLAHASQFGWTYARYQVADRIAAIEA